MNFTNYLQESKKTLILGVPFIVNQLLQISVSTIDSMMAGADSELTLAAVAQGAMLWMLVQLVLIGLAMALSPVFARLYARQDNKQLKQLFQQGVWLSIWLIPLGVLLMLCVPFLMQLVGVDAAIIPPATDYLSVMTFAIPFFALYMPIRFFNEGIGNPKVIMMITALSIPINVVGNYILLNGLLGFPKMGATGIAIASVLSFAFIAVIGWVYVLKSKQLQYWQLLKDFQRPDLSVILRFYRLGLPNAVALIMEAGMFTAVVLLSGRLGVSIAAANQIALSYISTTFMIPLGLSFAITTRVGMSVGEENREKTRIIGISGMAMGVIAMFFSVMIIVFFGEKVAALYTDDKAVIDIALGLLGLAAIFQIPDGVQVCSAGALRGLEETKAPMHYAILGYWILAMPLAILLAFYFNLGAKGLWAGLMCGLSITAFLGAKKFVQLTRTTPMLK